VRFVDPLNSALFVADIKTGQSRQLTGGHEYLDACSFSVAAHLAACKWETATSPTEVATVDLQSGSLKIRTSLNPKYNELHKARVEPFFWQDQSGNQFWGSLTYPLNYRPGETYPLIMSGQHGPGFARGSNGNEFPIQVFAAKGFFSLDMPSGYRWRVDATDATPNQAFDDARVETHELMQAIELAVNQLASRGVDSKRVGICGLSAGSDMTNTAISHSSVFSAAIAHSGQLGFTAYYLMAQGGRQVPSFEGSPYDNMNHLKEFSAAARAADIVTPLLIEAPDREYLVSLEQYQEMQDHHLPVELWMFHDEYHAKWQPTHRFAIYNRNVDWFQFWLQGYERTSPIIGTLETEQSLSEQYRRWETLCDLQRKTHPDRPAFCLQSKSK
jgi:dipeptidyl aminopeptidase/acylaminoacyl peptidase